MKRSVVGRKLPPKSSTPWGWIIGGAAVGIVGTAALVLYMRRHGRNLEAIRYMARYGLTHDRYYHRRNARVTDAKLKEITQSSDKDVRQEFGFANDREVRIFKLLATQQLKNNIPRFDGYGLMMRVAIRLTGWVPAHLSFDIHEPVSIQHDANSGNYELHLYGGSGRKTLVFTIYRMLSDKERARLAKLSNEKLGEAFGLTEPGERAYFRALMLLKGARTNGAAFTPQDAREAAELAKVLAEELPPGVAANSERAWNKHARATLAQEPTQRIYIYIKAVRHMLTLKDIRIQDRVSLMNTYGLDSKWAASVFRRLAHHELENPWVSENLDHMVQTANIIARKYDRRYLDQENGRLRNLRVRTMLYLEMLKRLDNPTYFDFIFFDPTLSSAGRQFLKKMIQWELAGERKFVFDGFDALQDTARHMHIALMEGDVADRTSISFNARENTWTLTVQGDDTDVVVKLAEQFNTSTLMRLHDQSERLSFEQMNARFGLESPEAVRMFRALVTHEYHVQKDDRINFSSVEEIALTANRLAHDMRFESFRHDFERRLSARKQRIFVGDNTEDVASALNSARLSLARDIVTSPSGLIVMEEAKPLINSGHGALSGMDTSDVLSAPEKLARAALKQAGLSEEHATALMENAEAMAKLSLGSGGRVTFVGEASSLQDFLLNVPGITQGRPGASSSGRQPGTRAGTEPDSRQSLGRGRSSGSGRGQLGPGGGQKGLPPGGKK